MLVDPMMFHIPKSRQLRSDKKDGHHNPGSLSGGIATEGMPERRKDSQGTDEGQDERNASVDSVHLNGLVSDTGHELRAR
jgi:hypothetical protein